MRGQIIFYFILYLLSVSLVDADNISVWQRGGDYARTNANNKETILNTRNVNVNQFGKLFSRQVLGHVYAQPLYIPNLTMPQTNAVHNVLFVATMGNNIYAFDADDPNRPEPLWQRNFGPTIPIADGMIGAPSAHCAVYTDILLEVGIVSTPVIDQQTNTLYFVNVNKESHDPYIVRHRLHAIDIYTGVERPNSPVLIEASVPGSGDGSENGILKFNSLTQNQRLALTIIDDLIYFGFASYCTKPPYHGWIFAYDKTTLERKFYFCTTPNGKEGGVWQSGQGLVWDGRYIYPVTANGDYDGITEWGDSFLKIDTWKNKTTDPYKGMLLREGIVDHFSPYNWDELWRLDLDLCTAGPILIPDTDCLFACSKQGWCYLVNKNNMGGSDPTTNKNIQWFKPNPDSSTDYPSLTMGTHGGVTTWMSPTKGRLVYVFPVHDTLKAFKMDIQGRIGKFNLAATDKAADNNPPVGFPGGIVSLSSDESVEGSAIVWAIHSTGGSANRQLQPSILRAFDANDISREIWNSNMNACRDNSGMLAKFLPALIVNGKVFVASQSLPPYRESKINIYGILPQDQQGKYWANDPCCYNEASCGAPDGWCCGGACYSPDIYYCANHTLCPRGQNCGPPDNKCVNCPNSCCGQQCYDDKKFVCSLGKICAIGMESCGTECIDSTKFMCDGGFVVPRPMDTSATSIQPAPTIITDRSDPDTSDTKSPGPIQSPVAVQSSETEENSNAGHTRTSVYITAYFIILLVTIIIRHNL